MYVQNESQQLVKLDLAGDINQQLNASEYKVYARKQLVSNYVNACTSGILSGLLAVGVYNTVLGITTVSALVARAYA